MRARRRQGENGCSTSFSSVLYHGGTVLSILFRKIFFIFLPTVLWQKCTNKILLYRPPPPPLKQVKSYKELPIFACLVRHDVARRNVAVKVCKICQKGAGNFDGLLFFTKIDANFRYFCPLYKRAELRYNSRAARRVSPRPQLAVKPSTASSPSARYQAYDTPLRGTNTAVLLFLFRNAQKTLFTPAIYI